eukprot:tig00000342_g24219.t1
MDAITRATKEYMTRTPMRLRVIDCFLLFQLLTGAAQFLYCMIVGTFPFNAFLSGFISCVGSFVLTVNLRLQVNKDNSIDFKGISAERAYADWLICNIIMHLMVVNFIG